MSESSRACQSVSENVRECQSKLTESQHVWINFSAEWHELMQRNVVYTVLAELIQTLLCPLLCSIQYTLLCILHSVFSAVSSPGRQQAGTSLHWEQATGLGREKESGMEVDSTYFVYIIVLILYYSGEYYEAHRTHR